MTLLKRISLFLLTNLAVIVLLNIILFILSAVFGINITAQGSDYAGIFVFALIVWFLGATISLFMSKWSAKRAYKLKFFTAENLWSLSDKEKTVYNLVLDLANREGIKMPEVWVYQSKDPNAFATWATKNSSLVAVSSALLENMTKDQVEWVVAHEMAHILNGDMVTMTLLQWVINTFVIFASRVIANIASSYFSRGEGNSTMIYYATAIGLDIVFGLFANMIVMWFSRHREYRADEGSARFVWKDKMIKALEALKDMQALAKPSKSKFATMKISTNDKSGGFKRFFRSHPQLDDRIKNLQDMRI